MKYFPFDKVSEMAYYMNKFEQTFQLFVLLAFIYFFIKVFILLDK